MAKLNEAMKRRLRRDAGAIDSSLRAYAKSAATLSLERPRLISKYPGKWIGMYQGEVAAIGDSLEEVKGALADQGLPISETIIRRIDKEETILILPAC